MSRDIRAAFDADKIRVYQAYNDAIADAALRRGTLASPVFSLNRMTWIKPSFLWMMYRCGWGEKDANQKRILAIDIKRSGFEAALGGACLSHYESFADETEAFWRRRLSETVARVQWDPERDIDMQPQDRRSLQVGLSGDAVRSYVHDWTVAITDITAEVGRLNALRQRGDAAAVLAALPAEWPYPIGDALRRVLHMAP